jgi:hypothetical protein
MKTTKNTVKKGKALFGADGLPNEATNPILGGLYLWLIFAQKKQESI